jgi:hypothetical protein
MEIEGKIKVIGETKTFGSNGFQKRETVITTEEQYPQHIAIDFVQDKCALLDVFKVGDKAKIGINLQGREWTDPQGVVKYFNSIQGWRIENVSGNTTGDTPPAYKALEPIDDNEEDDLPF